MNLAASSASVAVPWMPRARSFHPASSPARPARAPRAPHRSWNNISRSRPPIPTVCCSTGWAISTSFFSRTPRSPRARSALCSPSVASISAATSRCAACRSIAPTSISTGSSRSAIASQSASRSRIPPRRRSAAARAWCGATSSAWSRPARSPRTRCSTLGATIICSRLPARAHLSPRTAASRWPGSIFRLASFVLRNATAGGSPPRSPGLSPARSSCRTRFMAMPRSPPICARCLR